MLFISHKAGKHQQQRGGAAGKKKSAADQVQAEIFMHTEG